MLNRKRNYRGDKIMAKRRGRKRKTKYRLNFELIYGKSKK
jgi:hypothetical protein